MKDHQKNILIAVLLSLFLGSIMLIIGFVLGIQFVVREGAVFMETHGVNLTMTSQQIGDMIFYFKTQISQHEGSGSMVPNIILKGGV